MHASWNSALGGAAARVVRRLAHPDDDGGPVHRLPSVRDRCRQLEGDAVRVEEREEAEAERRQLADGTVLDTLGVEPLDGAVEVGESAR